MRRLVTCLAVALLVVTCAAALAGDGKAVGNLGNPGILPPQSHAFGRTYGDWAAAWWQWALSMPVDQNPLSDETGDRIANGQSGSVWFLGGVVNIGATVVRTATVPAGKALFFPVLNNECSTIEAPPFYGSNYAELASCAQAFNATNLTASIDGVAVGNLEKYFALSPMFSFSVPDNNILFVAGPQTGQSVTAGYWLMLAPLSAGTHVIHFGGTYPDYDFTIDITYVLTVK